MHRKLIASLLATGCLCFRALALAAAGKAGVVIEVDGVDAQAVSAEIGQALPDNVTPREPGDLTLALASQGIRGSLVDVLAASKARKQTLASIHKALSESNAAGILAAQSKRGKAGGHDVRVLLIVRSQSEPVIEEDVSAGKGENVTKALAPLLTATLQDVVAGPAAAPPDAASGAPVKPAESNDATTTAVDAGRPDKDSVSQKHLTADLLTAQIIASAGAELGTRRFSYSDYVQGALRAYGLSGMAIGSMGLEIYPLANTGTAGLKDIGMVGRLGFALQRTSTTRDGGQTASTTWTRFSGGLRGRIRAGDRADSAVVGLEATYGQWSFLFSGSDPVVGLSPSVEYKYVRPGADIRVPMGAFSLFGGAGYMFVLSAGPLDAKFPHATLGALDLKAGAGYAFTPALEARATLAYSRFFMSAHSTDTDENVVGGALDQYLVAHGGVAYAF
jgi:hypothetical protein